MGDIDLSGLDAIIKIGSITGSSNGIGSTGNGGNGGNGTNDNGPDFNFGS